MANNLTLLQWAKAGKKLVTQDGRPAKFVAYVPRAKENHRFLVLVGDVVWRRQVNGRHCNKCTGSVFPAIRKG